MSASSLLFLNMSDYNLEKLFCCTYKESNIKALRSSLSM